MGKQPFSGTFYHIFVHSFCDSNGDGIGDLPGIAGCLDYLQLLGIEGIWLSPIFLSPTTHKYDTLDYYQVDPQFGTMEDFQALLEACHSRGIRLLLDLSLNCASWKHPAFLKALQDKTCPERGWFWFDDTPDAAYLDPDAVWNGLSSWQTAPDGTKYIGIYGSVMPDYNFNDPGIRRECKNIAKFWLEKGVDGFRLDSAMHLFSTSEVEPDVSGNAQNIAWWQEFRSFCRTVKEDCLLVGEVWTLSGERALYYKCLDSTFHFYMGNYIANMLNGTQSTDLFSRQMESACRCARLVSEDYLDAPFLSNHDMPRFAEFSGLDPAGLKQAAAIYLTMEGIPFVYYGEELGMAPFQGDYCPQFGEKAFMERSRTAFPWEEGQCSFRFSKGNRCDSLAKQLEDPDSLLHFYRRIIGIRKESHGLRYGRWQPGTCGEGYLSYRLESQRDAVSVHHNLSARPLMLDEGGRPLDLMTGQPLARDEEDRWILLPKHSAIFYK